MTDSYSRSRRICTKRRSSTSVEKNRPIPPSRLTSRKPRTGGEFAASMSAEASADPAELFEHVYARPTAALDRQRATLLAELEELRELEESAP